MRRSIHISAEQLKTITTIYATLEDKAAEKNLRCTLIIDFNNFQCEDPYDDSIQFWVIACGDREVFSAVISDVPCTIASRYRREEIRDNADPDGPLVSFIGWEGVLQAFREANDAVAAFDSSPF